MKPKNILLTGALCLASLIIGSTVTFAQTPVYDSQAFTVPTVIVAGTSNLPTPPLLDVRKFQNVSITFSSMCASATGCTNQYIFQPSVDGLTFDTNSASAITCSNIVINTTGIAIATRIKLVPLSDGYWRLASVITTGISSNNTAKYGIKIGAP